VAGWRAQSENSDRQSRMRPSRDGGGVHAPVRSSIVPCSGSKLAWCSCAVGMAIMIRVTLSPSICSLNSFCIQTHVTVQSPERLFNRTVTTLVVSVQPQGSRQDDGALRRLPGCSDQCCLPIGRLNRANVNHDAFADSTTTSSGIGCRLGHFDLVVDSQMATHAQAGLSLDGGFR